MKDIKTNIPLPEVVWFQEGPGVRNTQYTISGVKLLNVANLVDGKIDLSTSDRYISEEEAYGRYKHFMADEGDLIIASSGIKVEYIDKKIGFIHKEHLPLCMNTSTIRFKVIDDKELNIKFFMYFLKSNEFKHQLFRHITGCAQLNFGPSHLKKMIISYPPLPEQSRIVEELDLLSNIIEKKRQQLSELDNLAQSIFYDMFGDPVTNEKGWEVKTFGEEFEISSGGTPDTKNSAYWDNGTISWIGSNLCQNIVLYNNDCKFITDLGFEKSSTKKYYPGYVLVALVGATIGKVALLKFETTTNQNVAGINVPKNESFTSEFVFYLLQQLYCMFEAVGGDKFKMANLKFIRSLPLILPPLSLQQLFAQKIEAIEKQKALIKQSIAETEELFNSRMDYYFN